MEIKQMKIFLSVCKHLSFTQTAKVLNYSQSTISETIINLEKELNIKLFDRIKRKIFLTEKGNQLEIHCRKILLLHDEAIYDIMNNKNYTINVGITESLCSYKFPSFFRSYLLKNENINFCFKIARCEEIPDLLKNNSIDIAFTLDEKIEYSDIKSTLLFEEEIVFIRNCNPKNKIINSYSDFNTAKVIISQGITGYNKIFYDIYLENNIEIGNILYLESIEGIKSYVKDGFGLTFIPLTTIEKEISEAILEPIRIGNNKYYNDVKILIHKDKYINSSIQNLIDSSISKFRV